MVSTRLWSAVALGQVCMKLLLGVVLVLGLSAGCYSLQPVVGNGVPLGVQVGLDINDAGRTALGGSMGPAIRQIEGRLVNKDSTEFTIAVSMIQLLSGGHQIWTGERIRIKTEYVALVSERRVSRGRTAATVAVTVGVLALVVRQSLLGSFFGSDSRPPADTLQSTRIPRS